MKKTQAMTPDTNPTQYSRHSDYYKASASGTTKAAVKCYGSASQAKPHQNFLWGAAVQHPHPAQSLFKS